jgi:CelD/BcsL family acetyltransferase involved in cellulose biosynthesis
MPYARRDAQGLVLSLHREAGAEAAEYLADDHPDVRAFLGAPGGEAAQASERFAQLDAGFVRVLEDLIDTLINRNLINITDLPAEAQAKLFSRKSFRERRSSQALRLYGDAELGPLVQGIPPADDNKA